AKKMDEAYYSEPENNRNQLILSLSDGDASDGYTLQFSEGGALELDQFDAYKLPSLKPEAIDLFGTLGSNRLSKNVLPLEIEANLELPIAFKASNRNSLTLNWQGLNTLPDNWDITLVDQVVGTEVDLRVARNYRFTVPDNDLPESRETMDSKLKLSTETSGTASSRFLLTINAGFISESEANEVPESVKLNPNYPNPFNPSTTISYELKEDSEVLLSIWNIVGQKVVTLVDEMKEAGEHTATWNASDMPSGLYIAQLEVGGEVFIRKMTLIK
ncbi:MAG: T9SS type A sorting domain-containing protein, partial [Pseudomonadota bacterium]|nr:T9SS type A sorting domain-containing protein [Pseudomonadota bacterium]